MSFRVAIVGATGNVGREMMNILHERDFPATEIIPIASRKSIGQKVGYGDKELNIIALDTFDFTGVAIAFFAAGSVVAKEYAPKAAKAGTVVIDNSSYYRMDPDVPLVVPEVNPQALKRFSKKNIIANPNCSTAQMLVALKPLHDAATIKRVVISTYQSVSGAGNKAMDELFTQTRAVFVNDPIVSENFPKQIAFNVIPHIDVFMDDGYTKEEWKLAAETHKMLDPDIKVSATAVRVPVFVGHAESINLEFKNEISADRARDILREAPGCLVIDKREDGGYITPVDCVGDFATYVSRIRTDNTVKHGLNIWVVSDNLRKGAALNAVQIAESLLNQGLMNAG